MAGSVVLDTVLGLVFVFLTTSLICTGVLELISNKLQTRGKYLLRGLREMLDLPPSTPGAPAAGAQRAEQTGLLRKNLGRAELQSLSKAGLDFRSTVNSPEAAAAGATAAVKPAEHIADLVLAHPLVAGLHRPDRPGEPAQPGKPGGGMKLASYVSGRTFARSLIDLLVPDGAGKTSIDELIAVVERLDESVPARAALLALLRDSGQEVAAFRERLEQWYDEQMGRVSGWYKRWAQRRLLVAGLLLALLMNVDTIRIGRALYTDTAIRNATVAQAISAQDCPAAGEERTSCLARQDEILRGLGLPLGWDLDQALAKCQDYNKGDSCYDPVRAVPFLFNAATGSGMDQAVLKLLGWLLTAFAVGLGAPFWFDALSKLGSLRTAGRRPGENAPFSASSSRPRP